MSARLIGFFIAIVLGCSAIDRARAEDCGNEASFKSLPGGTASDIYFHNGSSEQRRVYWIDDKGQRNLKAIVEAGQTQRQSTVATHTWVVTDASEKCLYVIQASSAPITAEIGSGAASPAASATTTAPVAPPTTTPQQPISPVAKFGLSGWYQIGALSKPGQVLNNAQNGKPELEPVKDDWESAYWAFEEVPGTEFVSIKNKWSGQYLQPDRGVVHTEPSSSGDGTHWSIESVDNGLFAHLRNKRSGRYLIATTSGLGMAPCSFLLHK